MYSFVPQVDISQVHTGFYWFAAVALFVAIMVVASIEDDPRTAVITLVILAAFTWGVHYLSYDPASNKPPLNQKVIGTLVGVQSEGWNEKSGKSRADHHVMYVTYRVPAGEVTLQAGPGVAYPQQAVLYKN
jgi:hypothetical protein